MSKMRKEYTDSLCDRCRVNPKFSTYILCVKCKDEWVAYGMKLTNSKDKSISYIDFNKWFNMPVKRTFIFR